jgi:hypothetical protein
MFSRLARAPVPALLFALAAAWLVPGLPCLGAPAAAPLEEAPPSEPGPMSGESLAADAAPELQVEPVGLPSGYFIHRLLPTGRANDRSPWRQLVYFKKGPRTERKSWLASVDFEKGSVRAFPACIPSLEVWRSLWADGKLWLAMNVMPRLAVYDPATDELTDLGEPFEGAKMAQSLYSIAVAPDGALALGGGTGTDLATYDPKTGKFTRYGKVGGAGAEQGFVYYVSIDEKHIYCALRGTGPTELVSVNRETKERKVLASRPANGWIWVGGNLAEVSDENKNKVYMILENGNAEEITSEQRQGRVKGDDRPGFTGKGPEVLLDDSPLMKGELRFRVLIPEGDSTEKHREAMIEAGLASEAMLDVAALPDGRIAGVGRGYGPMVIADPAGKRHELVAVKTSCYSVASLGKNVFLTGYPGTRLLVYDTSKPQTNPDSLPGKPGVPMDSPEANPRVVASLMDATGGAHVGTCLTPAADGRVYLIARRHRYFYGFALASCDGEGRETRVFDDGGAFHHYQIGWMSAMDHGEKLLIATRVQHNKQVTGAAAEEGALFVYDVKAQKIVAKNTPLPKVKALLGAVQTAPDEVVGVGQLENDSSVLYRLNLATGKTEQTRTIRATVCGPARGDLGVPLRSNGFVRGPDGWVWAGANDYQGGTLFVRVNPKDLSTRVVGRLNDTYNRLLFSGGQLYTSGGAAVQRVTNWQPLPK